MRKVVFDTNIVLDVLLDREPFVESAVQLFAYVENRHISGYLCATTVTTVYYLTRKVLSAAQTQEEMQKLLRLFEVAPVNKAVLQAAVTSEFSDFEDAVVHESAKVVSANAIVTRNTKDFGKAEIKTYSSFEFLEELANASGEQS